MQWAMIAVTLRFCSAPGTASHLNMARRSGRSTSRQRGPNRLVGTPAADLRTTRVHISDIQLVPRTSSRVARDADPDTGSLTGKSSWKPLAPAASLRQDLGRRGYGARSRSTGEQLSSASLRLNNPSDVFI